MLVVYLIAKLQKHESLSNRKAHVEALLSPYNLLNIRQVNLKGNNFNFAPTSPRT